MTHIALVTYELHPVNSGGAGVLIAGAVRALATAGYRCTVVCDFPDPEVTRAQSLLAQESIGPGSVRLVSVGSLAGGRGHPGPAASPYEVNSARFAEALQQLHRSDPIDLIEFPEYAGMGFATLRARELDGILPGVKVVLRAHGSLEFIDQVEHVRVADIARLRMYRMERLGLRMSDFVLVPSASMGEMYRQAHGLDGERLLVAPPPMEVLLAGIQPPEQRDVDPAHFLFFGKLQEVKGIDLLIEAAASLVTEDPKRSWRFSIVGRDTQCTAHDRMVSECIAPLVPRHYRDRFRFIPHIDRSELAHLAGTAVAGIVPSRFETFCLAAHELRAVGLPLIVSRIPGFRDYLKESTGCLTFDGSANGLRQAILRLREDHGLAESLASSPRPTYSPFRGAYDRVVQAPPRGDAGGVERALLLQELAGFEMMRPAKGITGGRFRRAWNQLLARE